MRPDRDLGVVQALLTQREVCDVLRCSRSTLWRICRRGDLPLVRLTDGGAPLFRPGDVEKLINSRTQTLPTAPAAAVVSITPGDPAVRHARGGVKT